MSLIFGTAYIGTRCGYKSFKELAVHARSVGICTFDTSPLYGKGLSQIFLQRLIREESMRIRIYTKIGRKPFLDYKTLGAWILNCNFSPLLNRNFTILHRNFHLETKTLNSVISNSLKYYNEDIVKVLFIHSPSEEIDIQKLINLIRANLGESVAVGLSDPTSKHLREVPSVYPSLPIQISYEDLNPQHKAFSHITINGALRYAQANNKDLYDLMAKSMDYFPNSKLEFNFSFYNKYIIDEIANIYERLDKINTK